MSAYLLEARGLSERFGVLVATGSMALALFAPHGVVDRVHR